MEFHVRFTYQRQDRDKLLALLHTGGLAPDAPVRIAGAWVATGTGVAYALVESRDEKAMYDLCSRWSDLGEVSVTPVISTTKL